MQQLTEPHNWPEKCGVFLFLAGDSDPKIHQKVKQYAPGKSPSSLHSWTEYWKIENCVIPLNWIESPSPGSENSTGYFEGQLRNKEVMNRISWANRDQRLRENSWSADKANALLNDVWLTHTEMTDNLLYRSGTDYNQKLNCRTKPEVAPFSWKLVTC